MRRDTNDAVPAIVRGLCEDDGDVKQPSDKIISQPKDTVNFVRGMGDSGYRVQVVEHDCPECQFDRMIRRIDVKPSMGNEVRYWCLNPNCAHYVSDQLSHACGGSYPQRRTSEPAVFEGSDA